VKAKKSLNTECKRRVSKAVKVKTQQLAKPVVVEQQAQAPIGKPQPLTRAEALVGQDFERLLDEHFAQEQQKKVDEVTDTIFGSVLARHGWVRNEQGQVEYVGGEVR